MRTRRTLGKRCCVWVNALIIMIAVGLGGLPQSKAQQITSLIEFTNVWKYDRSGLELGSAWRTNDFDDSAWPSGPGLLGWPNIEEGFWLLAPHGWQTLLPLSQTVTTYYFRVTFNFSNSTDQIQLFATNYVDDGCAIWLNGQLAALVNMPETFNATTRSLVGTFRSQLAVLRLNDYLRPGVNQLAVELHQYPNSPSYSLFGMKLVALKPTPLVFTNQPESQTVLEGDRVEFRVDVEGGARSYAWQKDGVTLGSRSNTMVISSVQLSSAGNYRAICYGPFHSVTSSVATLTVRPDLTGPTVSRASVDNGFGPDKINVQFSKLLSSPSVRAARNYSLKRAGADREVSVTNILYHPHPALGALLIVDPSDPDWLPDADYLLTINNVMDSLGNFIAPNTQVPVWRPWRTNIVDSTAIWSWHARYSADPTIYQQSWSTAGYVEDPQFWLTGVGPFCGGAVGQPPCGGDCESTIDYQLSPTLFRTIFLWPENLGTNGQLIVSGAVDDGLVLFLNGTQIWRTNFAGVTDPLTVTNYAATERSAALCFSDLAIPVTALLPGTNCLAAAVLQPRTSTTFESAFSLTAVAQAYVAKPLAVDNTPPTLRVESLPNNAARISWEGNGFALEYVTNLTDNAASYPAGPWIQAPGMSNPYTNRPPSPSRIFRLKR